MSVLCVCLSARAYFQNYMYMPDLNQILRRGSVLWRRSDKICTSGFVCHACTVAA